MYLPTAVDMFATSARDQYCLVTKGRAQPLYMSSECGPNRAHPASDEACMYLYNT